jgi:hypothetical protein
MQDDPIRSTVGDALRMEYLPPIVEADEERLESKILEIFNPLTLVFIVFDIWCGIIRKRVKLCVSLCKSGQN